MMIFHGFVNADRHYHDINGVSVYILTKFSEYSVFVKGSAGVLCRLMDNKRLIKMDTCINRLESSIIV